MSFSGGAQSQSIRQITTTHRTKRSLRPSVVDRSIQQSPLTTLTVLKLCCPRYHCRCSLAAAVAVDRQLEESRKRSQANHGGPSRLRVDRRRRVRCAVSRPFVISPCSHPLTASSSIEPKAASLPAQQTKVKPGSSPTSTPDKGASEKPASATARPVVNDTDVTINGTLNRAWLHKNLGKFPGMPWPPFFLSPCSPARYTSADRPSKITCSQGS